MAICFVVDVGVIDSATVQVSPGSGARTHTHTPTAHCSHVSTDSDRWQRITMRRMLFFQFAMTSSFRKNRDRADKNCSGMMSEASEYNQCSVGGMTTTIALHLRIDIEKRTILNSLKAADKNRCVNDDVNSHFTRSSACKCALFRQEQNDFRSPGLVCDN